MPTYYINQFSMGYIYYFFHNGKIKIHLVIQHFLKLANLQYIKGACFNISHTLEMTICVVNQLKNDSYC